MKILKTVATSCLLAAFAAIAGAQGPGGPAGGPMGNMIGPLPRGIFNPVVGSGAQYEVQRANNQKMTVEIDVMGKESVNGKDGYWLEATAGSPMGEMTMKMLMVSDGANSTIEKMIVQMPGRPPMEMPSQMGRMGDSKQSMDIRDKADNLGSESVTTPAGTFTADHYRMKDGSGDFWLSQKVSPYSLIKGQGKDFNMVLTKVVTDAKDKITGAPVPFDPRKMMPSGQPPASR
jgi:hypothetical protein